MPDQIDIYMSNLIIGNSKGNASTKIEQFSP